MPQVNRKGVYVSEDVKFIVGELKGEFRAIKGWLQDVSADVKELKEDFHQRRGMTKVAGIICGAIGSVFTLIVTKIAAIMGVVL